VWTKDDQPPTVKINQDNVRWEDLETRLAEIYLKRAEKIAFVRGDADVDFQYVADIIDRAHHAGVQRVELLTMEKEAGGNKQPDQDFIGDRREATRIKQWSLGKTSSRAILTCAGEKSVLLEHASP
jgi:hypothetical protein